MEYMIEKSVINEKVANGMLFDEVTVKSVLITQFDTNWVVQINTFEPIKTMFHNTADGTDSERMLKMVRLSEIDIMVAVKNDPTLSMMATAIRKQPQLLVSLLEGAKIALLSEKVEKGQTWTNFLSENAKEKVIKKDNIIHHVVGFEVGDMAKMTVAALKKEIQRRAVAMALDSMFAVSDRKKKTVSAVDLFADATDTTDDANTDNNA